MAELCIPLLITDFDGTLVNEDGHTIPDINRTAIRDYLALGGHFAISTGRMPASILPQARKLELQGILSACQGAVILDLDTEEVLLDGHLSFESTLAAYEALQARDLHILLFDLWKYYSNKHDKNLVAYETVTGIKATPSPKEPLVDFIREERFASHKVAALIEPERCDAMLEELQALGIPGGIWVKSASVLLEFVPTDYSKGTALRFLAERYGVEMKDTAAIGDQPNDLPMILAAGVGVAVKNADPRLKESADLVSAYTNEEGAVGHLIREQCLK